MNSYVFAGDIEEEIPGNMILLLSDSKIALVSVNINVSQNDVVSAIFKIKNLDNKKVNAKIAYPFTEYSEPLLKGDIAREYLNAPHKFIVKVNGDIVPIEKVQASEKVKLINPKYEKLQYLTPKYEYIYTWDVSLEALEEKTINCIYAVQWSIYPESFPSGTNFTYITQVGNTWSGNIRRAEIIVNLDRTIVELLNEGEIGLGIVPDNFQIKENKSIVWTFSNWIPDENISIKIWEK